MAAPCDLVEVFRTTVARLSGEALTFEALTRARLSGPVRILALGKAARGMARGAARALGPVRGLVVGPDGPVPGALPPGLRWMAGSHPVPDAASLAAGHALLAEASDLGPQEAALLLISGGGSALAAVPAPGLGLADKVAATRALLRGGCAIEEINAVRKHLSALKGGRLGAALGGRTRLALVLCDVPSGDLAAVASGPGCADPTTWAQALAAARRSTAPLPARVLDHLERGARGELAETPKPGDARLASLEHVLLAAPQDLARTAGEVLREAGCAAVVEPDAVVGRIDAFSSTVLARLAALPAGAVLVLAGEPTLDIPSGAPPGGRMQHLALLLARALAGTGREVVCAGSDGRDGATNAAGARLDGQTAARAGALGIDLDLALARCDSARVCAALGLALPAFDSGTNLCDLVLVR